MYITLDVKILIRYDKLYIEDITRLREDMDFMFECHENIKSISLSCRVMFFLLYGYFEFS